MTIKNKKPKPSSENSNNLIQEQLEQLERDSLKMLDDKIIAVGGALLGLTVGFINTIKSMVQTNVISGVLFLSVILALSITITYSVYSHYYSAYAFRILNEKMFYGKHKDFSAYNASSRIRQLNSIQTFGFILTIIFMVLLIFVVSSNSSIWVIKATIFSLFCLITTIIYYYMKSKIKNFFRFLINLIIFSIFIKGSILIWLIKPTNQIIQILFK